MRKSVSRMTRQARSSSTTRTRAPRSSSGGGAIGFGGVKGKEGQYIEALTAPLGVDAKLRRELDAALASCSTEADVVQVLERDGWYHGLAVEGGVLQDVRRNRVRDTVLGHLYEDARTRVLHPEPDT